MNMPVEMGMALFHAMQTQRREHRCLFFVPNQHNYQEFASDLAGLDPKVHNNEERRMLVEMYDWLRSVAPQTVFHSCPSVEVLDGFELFVRKRDRLRGSGAGGRPSHDETRELMYQQCGEWGWWDWRKSRHGMDEFPPIPLSPLP
jgi:hypothetical protein